MLLRFQQEFVISPLHVNWRTAIPPTQPIKALCIIVQGYAKGQAEEYQEKITFRETMLPYTYTKSSS